MNQYILAPKISLSAPNEIPNLSSLPLFAIRRMIYQ